MLGVLGRVEVANCDLKRRRGLAADLRNVCKPAAALIIGPIELAAKLGQASSLLEHSLSEYQREL